MRIDEAIEAFRSAAIEKGDFVEHTARDHALHEAMVQAWRALEEHGTRGREAFCAMLSDDSRHVRCWVASQLLALGDERGVPVLEAEPTAGGALGLTATIVLREWRAGSLAPPLGGAGR